MRYKKTNQSVKSGKIFNKNIFRSTRVAQSLAAIQNTRLFKNLSTDKSSQWPTRIATINISKDN
jgi:hypothetical protein